MDEGSFLGGQFGEVGAQFGEAAGNASAAYARIRNFKPSFKRKKQVNKQTALEESWTNAGLDTGVWEGDTVTYVSDDHIIIEGKDGVPVHTDMGTATRYAKEYDLGQQLVEGSPTYNPPNEVVEAIESTAAAIQETGMSAAEQTAFVEAFQSRSDPVVHATDYGGSDFYDYAAEGMQFGGGGGGGGRRGVRNTSTSVMNISINTRASVQDILSDLRRVQHMDDASFFNSVS